MDKNWFQAIKTEMVDLKGRKLLASIPCPKVVKQNSICCVFDRKGNNLDEISRHLLRVMAKGLTQTYVIAFHGIYALVVKCATIRTVNSIVDKNV